VCEVHGARLPVVKAAAKRRLAADEVARTIAQAYGNHVPPVDPGEALLQLVAWKHAEVVYLRSKVAELTEWNITWGLTKTTTGGENAGDTEEAKPNLWWTMLQQAQDQLATYAATALKAGVDERRVRIAEQQGDLVVAVIRRILDDLHLTDEQAALVPVVVPKHFRLIQEAV
jgi:hypothetical protein